MSRKGKNGSRLSAMEGVVVCVITKKGSSLIDEARKMELRKDTEMTSMAAASLYDPHMKEIDTHEQSITLELSVLVVSLEFVHHYHASSITPELNPPF